MGYLRDNENNKYQLITLRFGLKHFQMYVDWIDDTLNFLKSFEV